MKYRVNHTGKRYGVLTALLDVGTRRKSRWWGCQCDCGSTIIVKSADLGPSRVKRSCGCLNTTIGEKTRIHGLSQHPAHNVWSAMLNRCYREKDKGYKNYGARGIMVCERWRNSFASFWEDMEPTYERGLTIERRNNDGNYEPGNCYWASRVTQNQNRRTSRMISTPWGMLCLAEAARRFGVSKGVLSRQLEKGLR